MSFHEDLLETTQIEVMRRVLEPVDEDIPDPWVDFEVCVEGVVERTARTVKPMSRAERQVYFLNKARSGLEWCRRTNVRAEMTLRVVLWLERLERRRPS
jgi:hypothetical protein